MLYAVDLLGTFVFALSGAFQANRHGLDFLGFMVLAVATGVGGGMIRDVLLGATPPAALQDEWYLLVCLAGGMAVFWAAPPIARRWNRVLVADAVGLGVFAAMGAARAAAAGLGPIGIVLMAALTATGGGVVRDLLVREVPAVIKGGFYATAALLGGVAFTGTAALGLGEAVAMTTAAVVTTGLRFWAMAHNISLPTGRRFPHLPGDDTGDPA
ncbi:trimeric intracellular cation channel family protein [Rhodocaloribacter litoris]|uniref:trimeric intracellular cation channel family protein n=1 Tax=Rhodocaloribacter litoris TaxID=2558931 RepID=UPI001423D2BE|nr:trimeric intracellular cation channel family protein [Rhodocaloribacter litoris]QXD16652.1 trimeric intracellular cation channel family protein [Rhodocaloribacter litoris]GIV59347.1 MAG: membrane protein [Rhodothermaceae bacterium]